MQCDDRPNSPNWAIGCLAILLAACGPAEEPPAEAAATEQAQEAATMTGQDLFATNCGACHGPAGRGPSLETLKALSSEDLRQAILNHPTAGQIPSRLPANEIGDLIEFLEE